MGWPLDTRARHFRFELVGSEECARRVQALPFEEKCKVVGLFNAAENAATPLALFLPPIEVRIEHQFPGRVVGDFVVDENVDHDFRGTPFTVKRCSKPGKNASAKAVGEADRCIYNLERERGLLPSQRTDLEKLALDWRQGLKVGAVASATLLAVIRFFELLPRLFVPW